MKLADHIRNLIKSGYPPEILGSPRMTRHILHQKGISATQNQARLAIKRNYVPLYEQATGGRIISFSETLLFREFTRAAAA